TDTWSAMPGSCTPPPASGSACPPGPARSRSTSAASGRVRCCRPRRSPRTRRSTRTSHSSWTPTCPRRPWRPHCGRAAVTCSRTCDCSTSTPGRSSVTAASRWPTRSRSGRTTGRAPRTRRPPGARPPWNPRRRPWGRRSVAEDVEPAADGVRVPRILCIAGTDPSGGAGLLADVKAVAAMGGYGMGVVTAVTVQNTVGVSDVHPVPLEAVIGRRDAVADDVEIDAVKIGMLGEAALVHAVGEWLRRRRPPNVILDPVMVATTGGRLASDDAAGMLRDLVPLVDLVTPNVPELAVLCGEETATDIEM